MADYTRLTPDDIAAILTHYDLGRLDAAVPLEGGQANSSYRLTTSGGEFTLSVCDEKGPDDIRILTRVMSCLEALDFPTPRLVTPTGEESFIVYRSKPVYVKTFLRGRVRQDLTPAMAGQVGRALARLHAVPVPEGLPPAFPYGLKMFRELPDTAHPFTSWLSRKIRYLETALDLSMPRGFIHGDIYWDNLLFDGDRLTAVLDFEEACRYYLLFDLGMACVGCCAGPDGLDVERMSALMRGYRTARPLSGPEKEQFRPFLVYAAAAGAFWRFRQYNIRHPDPEKADNYLELARLADLAEEEELSVF